MTVIENSISHTSETYQANRAGMLAQDCASERGGRANQRGIGTVQKEIP